MKTLLITLLTLISLNSFSQVEDTTSFFETETIEIKKYDKDNLPQFLLDNCGDTIGIIMSVEQVQKLDSDGELLSLFKNLDMNVKNIDDMYISVINDQNSKITLLETKISQLENNYDKQKDMINTLKNKISNKEKEIELSKEQEINNQTIIEELKQDLSKEKTKKIIGVTTTSGVASILLALLIYVGIR
jgi:peptidoglycan hydrolase CwlO-like protein